MLKKLIPALALTLEAAGAMDHDLTAASLPSSIWFDGCGDGIIGITKLGTMGAGGAFTTETYPYYGITFDFNVCTKGPWAITEAHADNIHFGTWAAGAARTLGSKPANLR